MSPLLVSAAARVLDVRGAIHHQDERIGRHGARFARVEVRSMIPDADRLNVSTQ